MSSTVEFQGKEGTEEQWSSGSITFNFDNMTFTGSETQCHKFENEQGCNTDKTAGTFAFSDDKSFLVLTITQHDGEYSNGQEPESEVGQVKRVELAALKGGGPITSVLRMCNSLHATGDTSALGKL